MTSRGVAQAHYIAAAFDQPPSLIVTSPYRRAQQTALPTLARFPSVSQAEWPVQEFTYLAAARYVGTTSAERRSFKETYWQRGDPLFTEGAGAESFADFMARIEETLDRIRARDEFVAIFTHGNFTRTLLWRLLLNGGHVDAAAMQQSRQFAKSFSMPNGSLLKLYRQANGWFFSRITTAHLPESLVT